MYGAPTVRSDVPTIQAFNQPRGQLQLAAELFFQRGHLAVVGFVVMPSQVEEAVQQKDLQLIFKGMSKRFGMFASNPGRDRDISSSMVETRHAAS